MFFSNLGGKSAFLLGNDSHVSRVISTVGVGIGVKSTFSKHYCTSVSISKETPQVTSKESTDKLFLLLEDLYRTNRKIVPLYCLFFDLCINQLKLLPKESWQLKKNFSFAEMLTGLIYDPSVFGLNAKSFKQVFDAHLNEHREPYMNLFRIWVTVEKMKNVNSNLTYVMSLMQDKFLSYLTTNLLYSPEDLLRVEHVIFPLTKFQHDKLIYHDKLKLKANFDKCFLKLNEIVIQLGLASAGSYFYLWPFMEDYYASIYSKDHLAQLSRNFDKKNQKAL